MAVVVVVDDQGSARDMMRLLVKSIHESIEVQEFWDAEQALEWCCANSPDLVLLDYRMPSLDGITFAERLRACPAGQHCAMVMITSQGDTSIKLAALQAGIVEFVTKPIVPQEMKLRLRNLLELVTRKSGSGSSTVPAPVSGRDRGLAIDAMGKLLAVLRGNRPGYGHDVLSVERVVGGMAQAMQLGEEGVAKAIASARVYDIGMALIPDREVEMDRELTEEERGKVHEHVAQGRELLADVDAEIAEIVYRHHEHFNGSGYPDGLIGQQIPAISRVLSVADTFCSLISRRPHRQAFRVSEAVGLINGQSGTTFDPVCVDALVDCLPGLMGKTTSMPAREEASVGGQVR